MPKFVDEYLREAVMLHAGFRVETELKDAGIDPATIAKEEMQERTQAMAKKILEDPAEHKALKACEERADRFDLRATNLDIAEQVRRSRGQQPLDPKYQRKR